MITLLYQITSVAPLNGKLNEKFKHAKLISWVRFCTLTKYAFHMLI